MSRFWAATPSRGGDALSSLPLSWDSADRSLDALSGQVGTFIRAGIGGAMIDAAGRVAHARHSQARWDVVRDPITGRTRPGLLLEPARTNLVVRSEDFSTGWSDIGTPTLVAASLTAGDLVLSTLGDDNGAGLEGKSQVVPFTGNAVKGVSLFVAPGTSTSSVLRLRDTTAAANRLLAAITWSGTTPVVTMTTGVFIGQRELAEGIWELRFQTTSVTAANTNQIEIYPATTAALATANTGTIRVGGVAAYSSQIARDYLKTVGSAVAASAETLTWPFLLPRRRIWMYLALTELGGNLQEGGSAGLASVGDILGTGAGFYNSSLSARYAGFHNLGGSAITIASLIPGSYGDLVELLLTMTAAGRPSITVARNGVVIGTQTAGSDPADMTTPYTGAIARLGSFADATYVSGGAAYHALKVGEYGLSTPTLERARGYR